MHQMLREYLEIYGYWLLFAGTFLEGETILVMAGFLAFEGYLNLGEVMLTAFAGSFLGDQFFFYLGRWKGESVLRSFPAAYKKFRKGIPFLNRYRSLAALISRYTYGFRIILPLLLGMSAITSTRFLMLNLLSAASWGVVFAGAGYLVGKSASLVVDDVSRYEPWLMLVIASMFAGMWLLHFRHGWRRRARARERLGRMKRRKSAHDAV